MSEICRAAKGALSSFVIKFFEPLHDGHENNSLLVPDLMSLIIEFIIDKSKLLFEKGSAAIRCRPCLDRIGIK